MSEQDEAKENEPNAIESHDRLNEAKKVTAEELASYGGCKQHRCWKLLCCHSDKVYLSGGTWYWR